ncbi:hypothetical protein BSKO_01612 [Bryopsis sp. KO-2023]|nr:hypothetical protein BSKO_01612 [Bryopsis sp. KO-2023]
MAGRTAFSKSLSGFPAAPRAARPSSKSKVTNKNRSRATFRVTASNDVDMCRNQVNSPKDFQGSGKTYTVTFLGLEGQHTSCEVPDDEYILDVADANGIELPSTCRGGICGACVGRVVEGEVDMSDIDDLSFTVSEDEQADGMALLCMSRPKSDVKIETQCDWGYSLGVGEWQGATGRFSATPEPLMGDKENWTKSE